MKRRWKITEWLDNSDKIDGHTILLAVIIFAGFVGAAFPAIIYFFTV